MKLSEGGETLEREQWKGIICDGYKWNGLLQQPVVALPPRLYRSPHLLQLLLKVTAVCQILAFLTVLD